MSRVGTATRMGLREQWRRPLLLVLLIGLPFFFITRAIALTQPLPRRVGLPGGTSVLTTMRQVHGAVMATITIAFLAGICGVFVIQAARQADRRLVVAGFRPIEAIAPRLLVLGAATGVALLSSMLVTALSFIPRAWLWFVIGNLLVGLVYGGLGAIAGALLGRLGATHLMLFGAMLDLGVAQNPMFGSGQPPGWAYFLPGYGAARLVIGAGFSSGFHAWSALVLALGWTVFVAVAVILVLGHLLGVTAARAIGLKDDAPSRRLGPA